MTDEQILDLTLRTEKAVAEYQAKLQTDDRHSVCAWANPFGGAVKVARDWPRWVNGKPNGFVTAITSLDNWSDPVLVTRRLVEGFKEDL